ncbi:amidase [Streptomyces sp. DH12]|uniref:amidase family protein n=1 Tax=Streptomyces sp. DH12 TaxID=2857010 RepID=UPI001E5D4DD3|nr:amidase [Streptomyces sp. DH12]
MTSAAALGYLRHALPPDGGPVSAGLLLGPVEGRAEALAAAGVDRAAWREARARWAGEADRITRAMSRLDTGADLAGVTVSVKDTLDVAGMPTTLGHATHRHHPAADAPAVARVRALGLAVAGKAYATELNIGPPGDVLNPVFPQLSPAGSSTGSAVSVAAGVCDYALATDVLGSARWPAANCGVVGLRTTWRADGLAGGLPVSPTQDAVALMARTVGDLRLLWRRGPVAGGAPTAVPHARPPRVATVANTAGCAPVLAEAQARAVAALAELGVPHVRTELPPWMWRARADAWELCGVDVSEVVREVEDRLSLRISPVARASLAPEPAPGRRAELLAAQQRFRRSLAALLDREGIDVLLMPVGPTPPKRVAERAGKPTLPKPGDADYADRLGYTPVASFAGLPALVLPAAVDPDHGPLAVQLVGRPREEARLLALGADLERLLATRGELAARVARTLREAR